MRSKLIIAALLAGVLVVALHGNVSAAEQNPGADSARPWHESPLVLKGKLNDPHGNQQPVTLVPMGCTTLRRTTFEARG